MAGALAWAGAPPIPPLVEQARRHLRAAIASQRAGSSRGVLHWADLVASWGAEAQPAVPELLAAIPYAPIHSARGLAACGATEAVQPLAEAMEGAYSPYLVACSLTELTADGSWCERAWDSANSKKELIRTWAVHPTPGLHPALRSLVTGRAAESWPGQREQLAAIEILGADDADVRQTLEAIVQRQGEPATEAARILDRLG